MTTKVISMRQDPAALRRLLNGSQSGVSRDIFRRGNRVLTAAKRLCPVDTGRLRSSITLEIVLINGAPVARIGTVVNYARFVHDGTGIYGSSGAPIRPKKGRWLVFTPKGQSSPVFAKSVRGMRGVPFLRDALPAAKG
jgi:hypothetical protein